MKKILLYIVGLLIVGVVAMPIIVKNQVEKQIKDTKQTLNEIGIELTIIKDEGYISSYREFEMKILNGRKFRDSALQRFAQKNPNYKGLIHLLQKQSENDIRPALDGITFYGTLENSNLLLNAPKIVLSLTKFSDEMMSNLYNNKQASKLVHSILDEKIFTFFITLDNNQQISQVIMKDIDKNINDNGKNINVKLKNNKLDIDIKDHVQGIYTLGEQSLKSKKFSLKTTGIQYKFDYLTQFKNRGNLHVNSIEFRENKGVVKVGNIDISSNSEISNINDLSVNIKYNVKDVYYQKYERVELDNLALSISLSGLDKDNIIHASNAYNKLTFKPKRNSMITLITSLEKILNKGFKVDVTASLRGLSSTKLTLGDSDFILNLKVATNKYTIQSKDIINAVLVDGKLTVDEKHMNDIIKIDRKLSKFAKLGKKQGSKIVYNYQFKQGTLFINGNKL